MSQPNLRRSRAKRARYARRLKGLPIKSLEFGALIALLSSLALYVTDYPQYAYLVGSLFVLQSLVVVWYRNDLQGLPIQPKSNSLEDILAADALGLLRAPMTAQQVFNDLRKHWHGNFIFNHLYFLYPESCADLITDDEATMDQAWQKARELQITSRAESLNAGTVLTALLLNSKPIIDYAATVNLKPDDLLEVHDWLQQLERYLHTKKPNFGGIGRDWATGYTPTLDNFSQNISKSIERGGGHYQYQSESGLHESIIHSLAQGPGGVALIGEDGIGKT